jgi:hypothetical protein
MRKLAASYRARDLGCLGVTDARLGARDPDTQEAPARGQRFLEDPN